MTRAAVRSLKELLWLSCREKRCCSHYIVTLTGRDIWRISEAMQLPPYPAFLSDGIVHLRDDVLCPPRSWNLAGMDVPVWRERLLRFQMEYDIYCYVVERWNGYVETSAPETGYPVSVYYGYLMAVYGSLEVVRQALSADETEAVLQRWGANSERRINPLKAQGEDPEEGATSISAAFVSDLRQRIDGFFTCRT